MFFFSTTTMLGPLFGLKADNAEIPKLEKEREKSGGNMDQERKGMDEENERMGRERKRLE